MGSLRNPIGPLPSSIYWRRRAVAASLVALLALLVVWAVSSGGDGGGGDKNDDGANGSTPAPSITPGPTGSGPAISEQPGGRDESDETGGGDGGDSGGGDGGSAGSGGDSGKNGDNGAGGASNGGAGGEQVPAGSSLPDCAPSALKLTLRSLEVSYGPGEKPTFQLVATNSSATACKADFGPKAAVLKVVDDENETVWSSKDCPREADGLLLKVPANTSITHTVEWDRKRSASQCATPPAGAVQAGSYLVEADFPGAKVLPAPFRLEKD
ncbi:hypothetical protein AB0M39_21365 [Streptomyces sp. NPDC051907]|uniref:hypothetical protein n=1 Tax=Streptomyces sp. NPDC051907 TaxID=3155284 RepID=UPI003440DD21